MSKQVINSAFLTEQIVGTCQISGIKVPKEQKDKIDKIISGQTNSQQVLAELLNRYSKL